MAIQKKNNQSELTKPFSFLSPSQKSADLARVRDNQRRSRARRKEYLQELETKYWTCEQVGVGASAEIQAAARLVVNENKRLRALLMKYGISSREINGEGEETASSVVENLEAMMGKRRACGGGTGGRADVMAAESCEKSLVAIRYGHSQMPDRGLRQLQIKGTIPSPQSSGNGLRKNGGSLAGNTGVLQQLQQQHSEAHQQQQHQQQHQQQFAALRHTQPPQAPLPPQQNHTPIQSNTHTYATTSASASSSSTSSTSNPEQIYATTSTYSPGSSSSLYGGGNNSNNNPDYCYTQHHHHQQNHQHNDFFAHNNLDIYSAAAAAVPVPHHQQQNQYQQQPNNTASCRDIADAIRCIRPSLTLQELDEEMGCHQLCDADGGGGGGSSCGGGGGDGGIGDCKVPHYKAFELMDRLSN